MVNHEMRVEAEDLEGAIEKGLEELDLHSKDEMEWEVISEGEERVELKVWKKESEKIKLVKDEVNTFLEKLGTSGSIEIKQEDDKLL